MRTVLKNGLLTGAESWPGHPRGPLCAKAYGLIQQHWHPNRLLHPYKRTAPKGAPDPGFTRISWDEAYDLAAAALGRIRREYGPHSVFFYCGGVKEPRAAVMRLAALFGTANYGTESSTACQRAATFAEHLCFGASLLDRAPGPASRVALLWGVNPAVAHHTYLPGLMAAKAAGCRFIVIDPRATATAAQFADIHLRPRLGATAALAAGMARHALVEGWHDEAFCRAHIHGFDEYCDYVRHFDPDQVRSLTGVAPEDVAAAVRMYASRSPRAFSSSAQSTVHDRNGIANHRGIALFSALFGDMRPQDAAAPTGLPRDFDMWPNGGPPDFSLRPLLESRREHRMDRRRVPAWADWSWEVNTSYLPEAIASGEIRALAGFGLNTQIWPQPGAYSDAFARLDFGMAADYFYRPRSHLNLDLLLPAADNFERRAPFGLFNRRLFGRTALAPRGEAREDWQIALELGSRLGHAEECFHGNVEAACDSILARWNLSYADLDAALAQNGNGIDLPVDYFLPPAPDVAATPEMLDMSPAPDISDTPATPPARPPLPVYATPTGKIEAVSTHLVAHGLPGLPEYKPPYPTSAEYPLQLLAGTRRPHITHGRTRSDTPWLLEIDPRPEVELNPQNAARLGIRQGALVEVRSPVGRLRAYARLAPEMPPGMVGMMHGWSVANVNDLIPRAFDPASGYAALKEVAVSVTPVEGEEYVAGQYWPQSVRLEE